MPQFSAPRALAILTERGLDNPFIVVSSGISEEVAVDYAFEEKASLFHPAGRSREVLGRPSFVDADILDWHRQQVLSRN